MFVQDLVSCLLLNSSSFCFDEIVYTSSIKSILFLLVSMQSNDDDVILYRFFLSFSLVFFYC